MLAGAAVWLAEPATTTAASAPGRGQRAGITGPGELLDVAALSARYAWAVGLDQDHLGFTDIVIEHWKRLRWH